MVTDQRLSIVLAAVVAVGGTAAVLVFGPFGGPGLAEPATRPDPVPAERLVAALPEHCGLSAATVARLVPEPITHKAGDTGECKWFPGRHGRDRRYLTAGISIKRGTSPAAATGLPIRLWPTPVTLAMDAFPAAPAPGESRTRRRVTGLGDEAIAQYSARAGGDVVFRFRNAVVTVGYSSDPPSSLPERAALGALFSAASEIQAALGGPRSSRPAAGAPIGAAPPGTPPKVCGAVRAEVLDELVDGADLSEGAPEKGTAECSWEDGDRALRVQVTALADAGAAAREYLQRHLRARAEEPISARDAKYFRALARPGEQGFAAFVDEGSPGRVCFRIRNLVVDVALTGVTGRERAVGGAYTAALDVARALAQ